MNKILNLTGLFTWFHGHEWFIETESNGNFYWSDGDYPGGDNTIYPFNGSLRDFMNLMGLFGARGKGRHIIKEYCGDKVKISSLPFIHAMLKSNIPNLVYKPGQINRR